MDTPWHSATTYSNTNYNKMIAEPDITASATKQTSCSEPLSAPRGVSEAAAPFELEADAPPLPPLPPLLPPLPPLEPAPAPVPEGEEVTVPVPCPPACDSRAEHAEFAAEAETLSAWPLKSHAVDARF